MERVLLISELKLRLWKCFSYHFAYVSFMNHSSSKCKVSDIVIADKFSDFLCQYFFLIFQVLTKSQITLRRKSPKMDRKANYPLSASTHTTHSWGHLPKIISWQMSVLRVNSSFLGWSMVMLTGIYNSKVCQTREEHVLGWELTF